MDISKAKFDNFVNNQFSQKNIRQLKLETQEHL